MKNIILIIFLFFTYSCGYTSVYKNIKSDDLKINVIKTEGDRDMNNLIKNEIKLFSNEEAVKKFDLLLKSNFEKIVLTKNSAGVVTDYELKTNVAVTILFNEKTEQVNFRETLNVRNKTNTFEQNLYEKNVKRNFASSIREKLIFKILKME